MEKLVQDAQALFNVHITGRQVMSFITYEKELLEWNRKFNLTAIRDVDAILAAYYGGGVHSRGTMGLGPPGAVLEALGRYADAGVTDLCIRFVGDDQRAQLEHFTADVLPALA